MELHAATVSLDPREWKAGALESATDEKMGALVYDRLVALDNYGRFQPQLATEWSHDAAFKRWQFTLRANVKYSDGTTLTTGDVVAALQPLLPDGQQIITAGNSVVIQSATPMPDLLEQLASARFFIYRAQPDGTLLGTGPFFVAETTTSSHGSSNATTAATTTASDSNVSGSLPGANKTSHLRFRANEETWSGRPFLDAIDVTLGVPPLRQLFDLQLGKADLVELTPELVRRAMQDNQRVWTSAPIIFYGLCFDGSQPAAADANLRDALSLSLDRQTMANVLLQRQAEPASALLPQWLSGYAFLFTMETNIERAKDIRATLPASAAPLRLRVDATGDLAKLLGERVAVNARQAAILVQVVNRTLLRTTTTSSEAASGVHLFSWHYSSLSPRVELESMVSTLNLGDANEAPVSLTDPELLYTREKKLLEERRLLPLVALPEYVGLGQKVRDWMPARWGEWHLAEVWLDLPEASPVQLVSPNASETPAAAPPGAKP